MKKVQKKKLSETQLQTITWLLQPGYMLTLRNRKIKLLKDAEVVYRSHGEYVAWNTVNWLFKNQLLYGIFDDFAIPRWYIKEEKLKDFDIDIEMLKIEIVLGVVK